MTGDKMIWVKVSGELHKQFKPILREQGKKRGVKLLEQVELGKAVNKHMARAVRNAANNEERGT